MISGLFILKFFGGKSKSYSSEDNKESFEEEEEI